MHTNVQSIQMNAKKGSDLQEITLLEAVERQNSHRKDIVLVDICDNLCSVLGAPATEERRIIQEHWANVKRKKTGSYVKLLKRRGVEPSETTKKLLRESTMGTPPPSDTLL